MASTTAAAGAPSSGTRSRGGGKLYRGDLGMWSWVAHRITGVLTFFFLFVHVIDTALVRVSPDAYDEVISLYKEPFFVLFELGLVAAILFHALNGVRIMLVDFWSKGPRLQRPMLWTIIVLWLVVMIPGTYYLVSKALSMLLGGS
ncbi:succinate dehydrogenase, cytochrome b556 subunit [Allokutzneria sp. A3M-2-11 16]|uniref:succinate dehydrogenase, cytochrome b556 subunit n=1 Tax=Allokutzneria sp. A3M-2-11 16 TaxID=2962043 RepID=UPI0020B76147|nr:succinate dehydrogenase, cytochrome b556 subunit [Allokutzneria sp. A3M-2-11 16]MCP3800388.1 succinate dehydrogenase, cytochrome b556 subunit [Allokutzneria sp. A3M-2-11 16]